MVNGLIVAHYEDGSADTLRLVNPDNWCPIEQDYYIDDYAPDSYHEVGDYAVIPVFIKPFRKKNGDPSYSLSVQKAYRHHSKGESF